MFGLLSNPKLEVALIGVVAAVFLMFGIADLPPRVTNKGKRLSFGERWRRNSRQGRVFVILGSLLVVSTVAGILDIAMS